MLAYLLPRLSSEVNHDWCDIRPGHQAERVGVGRLGQEGRFTGRGRTNDPTERRTEGGLLRRKKTQVFNSDW
jgi:hypothetical protein